MLFQFEMAALLEDSDTGQEEGGGQTEGESREGIGMKKKRKPEGRWWYGTFVSNPIPHTIWLHYHYAGEKTSVSLKIKTYLAPSKLTLNETCLSPCDSVSVIAPLLHSLRSVFGSSLQLCAVIFFFFWFFFCFGFFFCRASTAVGCV